MDKSQSLGLISAVASWDSGTPDTVSTIFILVSETSSLHRFHYLQFRYYRLTILI